MKVCIVGAGAIGCFLAAKISQKTDDVVLLARGNSFKTIKRDGITICGATEIKQKVRCVEHLEDAGQIDLYIIALKNHDNSLFAEELGRVIGPNSYVMNCLNGVPWWFFHGLDSGLEKTTIDSIDKNKSWWNAVGPERVVGTSVFAACQKISDGNIRHVRGEYFPIGHPTSIESVGSFSEFFMSCGLNAELKKNIHEVIWYKLWGNLGFNAIATITDKNVGQIANDKLLRATLIDSMNEVGRVGESLGIYLTESPEKRIDSGSKNGSYAPSMLQDHRNGRKLEKNILKAVIDIAEQKEVNVPSIRTMFAILNSIEVR